MHNNSGPTRPTMSTYLELLVDAAKYVDRYGLGEVSITEDTDESYGTWVTSSPTPGLQAVQSATYARTADHAMLVAGL